MFPFFNNYFNIYLLLFLILFLNSKIILAGFILELFSFSYNKKYKILKLRNKKQI